MINPILCPHPINDRFFENMKGVRVESDEDDPEEPFRKNLPLKYCCAACGLKGTEGTAIGSWSIDELFHLWSNAVPVEAIEPWKQHVRAEDPKARSVTIDSMDRLLAGDEIELKDGKYTWLYGRRCRAAMDKAVHLLIEGLDPDELYYFGASLDGGGDYDLLDRVNARCMELCPERFHDPDLDEKQVVKDEGSCYDPNERRPANYYHDKKTCDCAECSAARRMPTPEPLYHEGQSVKLRNGEVVMIDDVFFTGQKWQYAYTVNFDHKWVNQEDIESLAG